MKKKDLSAMKKVLLVILFIIVCFIIFFILVFFSCIGCPNFAVTATIAKEAACAQLKRQSGGCQLADTTAIVFYKNEKLPDFDANKDNKTDSADTLFELCKNYYGVETESQCKMVCGCS